MVHTSPITRRDYHQKVSTRPITMDKYGKVLGLTWNSKEDIFCQKIVLNLKKKVGNIKDKKFDLTTREEISQYVKDNGLTKRQCLRAVALLWNPLGLYLPIKSNLFLLYRKLLQTLPQLRSYLSHCCPSGSQD